MLIFQQLMVCQIAQTELKCHRHSPEGRSGFNFVENYWDVMVVHSHVVTHSFKPASLNPKTVHVSYSRLCMFGFKEAGLKLCVTTWSRGSCNQSLLDVLNMVFRLLDGVYVFFLLMVNSCLKSF